MVKDADAEKGSLVSVKRMLKFLDMVPHKYKVGPWSPVAHIVLLAYACFLILTMLMALDSQHSQNYAIPSKNWLQTYRLLFGLYGIATSVMILRSTGLWPMLSYTLTSWNLMTVRLLSSFLAGAGVAGAGDVANFVRFPALAGCSITVSIWWTILVPLIDHLLSKDKDPAGRVFFWKWNMSPMLINVHLLNLPIVGIEFLLSNTALTFFDLWAALVVAFLYCLMYLNVLDPRGLHFYIIFTPRTAWCFISYVLVLSSYYVFYVTWNALLAQNLLQL